MPTEAFDVNALVEETCSGFAPGILSRDLDFEFSPSPVVLLMTGDPVLIGEALTNVLENALRHGGEGMTQIAVRVRRSGDDAVLTVTDDGIGIPPEQADNAFRRFSQLRNGVGTGLGLAIVEQVTERHGGSVALCPVDRGTCVQITLPLRHS